MLFKYLNFAGIHKVEQKNIIFNHLKINTKCSSNLVSTQNYTSLKSLFLIEAANHADC